MEELAFENAAARKIQDTARKISSMLESFSGDKYTTVMSLLLVPIEEPNGKESVSEEDDTMMLELDRDLQFCPLTGEFYRIKPVEKIDIEDFLQYRSANPSAILKVLSQFNNLIRLYL